MNISNEQLLIIGLGLIPIVTLVIWIYVTKSALVQYDYEEDELWEPPPYWTNWQKHDPTVVDHGIEINHYGDDDWHNEQHV